jgi:hypothetical protein
MSMAPSGDHDPQNELLEQLNRLEELIRPSSINRSGNSTIHIDAGGISVKIAITACVVTLIVTIVVTLIGAIAFVRLSDRIDRAQDYINETYMAAPKLKPSDYKGF